MIKMNHKFLLLTYTTQTKSMSGKMICIFMQKTIGDTIQLYTVIVLLRFINLDFDFRVTLLLWPAKDEFKGCLMTVII